MLELRCAFCGGTGKDPFDLLSSHASCEVCAGSGKVMVTPPVRRCAFCHGSGVFPRSRLTCTTCMGKGAVTVEEPAELCPACVGIGVCAGHSLPCSVCAGKGFVPSAQSPQRGRGRATVLERGGRG
jgi:DnaJ-class molecular chaperone